VAKAAEDGDYEAKVWDINLSTRERRQIGARAARRWQKTNCDVWPSQEGYAIRVGRKTDKHFVAKAVG